jgi:salicylate hydroxylase
MKIGVIGAGLSGLTFTAALRRSSPGIQVDIYERGPSVDSRFQGYSLGLRGDGGLPVLKSLGLYEELSKQAVTISNFVFCDQSGRVLLELPAAGSEQRLTQRVKRQALRTALLGAIGDAPVHSGMPAAGVRQNERGVEIQFENGQTALADYLVACDGASSAIRRQLFKDQKHYLDLTTILFDSPHRLEHPLLEGGYFMTLGRNGTSVFCYRQPDGIHLSYTVHASSEKEISVLEAGTLLRLLQLETRYWHAPIPEIVAGIDPSSVVVRGCYDREPLKHVRQGRVWLIGDAAHPMSPMQGQGANMALVDAHKLAGLFAEMDVNPGHTTSKSRALERDIVTRGRRAVLDSRAASRRFHTTDHLQQRLRDFDFQVNNALIQMVVKK